MKIGIDLDGVVIDSETTFRTYEEIFDIKFKRNNEGFPYTYEQKTYRYYPDFILEDGTYVEIKGYMTAKNLAKINAFPHNIKILGKDEIKFYLNYCIMTLMRFL